MLSEERLQVIKKFLTEGGSARITAFYFVPTASIIEKLIERNEKTGELLKKVRDTIDYDTKEQVESVRKSALAAMHVMNLACRVNSAGNAAAAVVTKLKA